MKMNIKHQKSLSLISSAVMAASICSPAAIVVRAEEFINISSVDPTKSLDYNKKIYVISSEKDFEILNQLNGNGFVPAGAQFHVNRGEYVFENLKFPVIDGLFRGQIYGNDSTIIFRNCQCGLFCTLGENSYVENLNLEGEIKPNFIGLVGALARVLKGRVSYVVNNAKVIAEQNRWGFVAGLAGENYGTMIGCANNAEVRAEQGCRGPFAGLVGENHGTIECCENNAEVRAEQGYQGPIAGLAGENHGTIKDCANKADIKVEGDFDPNKVWIDPISNDKDGGKKIYC